MTEIMLLETFRTFLKATTNVQLALLSAMAGGTDAEVVEAQARQNEAALAHIDAIKAFAEAQSTVRGVK